jgi:signal transduction histidine kinase
VAGAAVFVVAALVLVGVQLRGTQATARESSVSRFHDRVEVISALTQAVLSSASGTAESARKYGGVTVSPRVLDQAVAQGHLAFAVLIDRNRNVIAASRTLTGSARAQVLASAALGPALAGAPVSVSDVLPGGPGGTGAIALAVSLETAAGRRVLVTGVPTPLLSPFLSGYLRRVPTPAGTAYVVDSRGNVVGARDANAAVGKPVTQLGLLTGIRQGPAGSFGRDGYFVAAPVPGSSWRVVLTATRASLFSGVSGSRKWLPWVIYVALGIVALAFLVLLRRLLGSSAALSAANGRLASQNARLESSNALLRHAAELERSNAELEQFASIASHDLQEPLRKVQTFAAQLTTTEHERLSEEGQDYLRRMSAAAGRMRGLIDDLLMFSRVSTKGRPFVPVDLDAVVAQVLVDLELSIEETGASVVIADLPTIDADPVQMRQLLQNLLENALKFRRDDVVPDIVVGASVVDGIAEFTIRDNGLGFETQYSTRIFRVFERLNGTSAYPGTGIGLALCRKIVERHHGMISADSRLGSGAVFTVRLPVEQSVEAVAPRPVSLVTIGEEASHALT